MKARVTGQRQVRSDYKMIFLRGEDGKCYLTHIDRKNGNAARWWNLKQGEMLDKLIILRNNIINADSLFSIIRSA